MGYTHEGRKFVLYKGEEKEVRHVVHYPPDVQACIFWLRNRRRKQWLEGAKEEPDNGLTVLEIEEAAERARRMREQTHEQ